MSVGAVTLCGMESEFRSTLRYLAQRQSGVVSRSQALRAGLTTDKIKFRLRSGRWRLMHPGVYATFTGVPGRGAWLWAAVLSAGPGAALSHETAAELHRLTDKPAETIHVTVPHDRRVMAVEGVSLHRSARAVEASQGNVYPPRTTVEETVLDLAQAATSFDDVCGWVTRAIARGLTDEEQAARGHDRTSEAALARGPARTHRRRRGRRPFGARVPLSPRRGASAWPAGIESAGAVRDAGRAAGAPRPRVRGIRRGGGA